MVEDAHKQAEWEGTFQVPNIQGQVMNKAKIAFEAYDKDFIIFSDLKEGYLGITKAINLDELVADGEPKEAEL